MHTQVASFLLFPQGHSAGKWAFLKLQVHAGKTQREAWPGFGFLAANASTVKRASNALLLAVEMVLIAQRVSRTTGDLIAGQKECKQLLTFTKKC